MRRINCIHYPMIVNAFLRSDVEDRRPIKILFGIVGASDRWQNADLSIKPLWSHRSNVHSPKITALP